MRIGLGLIKSWICRDELWRPNVLDIVGLKQSTMQEEGNDRLDGLMVPNKDTFHYLGLML
jgi:hypothetical protein